MNTQFWKSKKFWYAVAAAIVTVGMIMAGYSVAEAMAASSPITGLIVGQGIADMGKERAKVEYVLDEEAPVGYPEQ